MAGLQIVLKSSTHDVMTHDVMSSEARALPWFTVAHCLFLFARFAVRTCEARSHAEHNVTGGVYHPRSYHIDVFEVVKER